ncbi:MAG: formylglycine-generating enzyme family protein [Bacteroidales bacterium]|nr:formylglycine-generating enzyme family protein [Bacteroidales bacterium]
MDAEMKFAYIPAGTVSVGPVVQVAGFWMGVTPVTQAQFKAVMGYNPSHFTGDESRPVEQVSWFDARDFCTAMVKLTGKPIRLPTEAEWQHACRDAGDNEEVLKRVGWYSGNSNNSTQPVGKKEANAYKLHDMRGNVWEWCADIYRDPYTNQGQAEFSNNDQTNARILRGGGWYYNASVCVSTYRNWVAPVTRLNSYGFRVCFRLDG